MFILIESTSFCAEKLVRCFVWISGLKLTLSLILVLCDSCNWGFNFWGLRHKDWNILIIDRDISWLDALCQWFLIRYLFIKSVHFSGEEFTFAALRHYICNSCIELLLLLLEESIDLSASHLLRFFWEILCHRIEYLWLVSQTRTFLLHSTASLTLSTYWS